MNRSLLRRIGSLALALLLSVQFFPPALADSGEEGGGETVTGISVSLDQSKLTPAVGEPVTLTATLTTTPADVEIDSTAVLWEWVSTNSSIVQVEQDASAKNQAVVTPQSAGGMATITVKATYTNADGSKHSDSATCEVVVQYVAADSIGLNRETIYLDPGKSQDLKATVRPEGADPSNVEWSTTAESVAKVSPATGSTVTVTAVAPGNATVTANSGGKEAKCNVYVPGVVLDKTTLTLTSGSSETLSAQSYGDIGTSYLWTSSNENVASVNNGKVTAKSAGSSTITVTVNGTTYAATCSVTVTENTAGVITESASAGQPVRFSDLESAMDSQCRSVLGSPLSYVTNLSVPTNQGILYFGYVSADDTGAGVGSQEKYYYGSAGKGQRTLSDVTFLAKPDFSGAAVVSYSGYDSSNNYFNGTIRITVEETSDVIYSTGVNTPVSFRASDFSAVCRNQNGRDVNFVTFTLPAARYGSLYYNYVGSGQLGTAVESNTGYYRAKNPYLDNVSFVPASGYTGTVRVGYSGEDASGNRFSGRVTIYVSGSGGSGSGDISYSAAKGERVSFKLSDFNNLCREATGDTLDYVRFDLPASSKGTLYYDYTSSGDYDYKVGSSDRYYRSGSPYLSKVSFVPKSGYSGTVEIDFTGYSDDGDRFSGTVEITVGSGGSASGSLTYRTAKGEPVDFSAGDFNDVCKDELGVNLDYVRFTLPSSSRGTLYYDYTSGGNYDSRVSSSASYYRTGSSRQLSRVTFVPQSGYTGTVDIDFTGYGTDGARFTGTVKVIVGDGGDGTVTYEAKAGRAVTFSATDFNNVCKDLQGVNLDYVRFDLPASGDGTLYYNYTSGGSSDGRVSASTSYYRTGGSRQLSKVSFVPASGAEGTVSIGFTGYDVDGGRFNGVVKITVDRANAQLQYAVKSFQVLTMDAADFNAVCRDVTGSALDYVRFTPPSAAQGALYYDYETDGGGSAVAASTSYYRTGGSRQLSRVSFVPAQGYSGTVELSYTGWSTGGERFNGTVRIEVTTPVARVVRYATDAMPIPLRSGDLSGVCSELLGSSLDYVQFILPDSNAGRLYYNYTGPNSYDAQVRSGVSYYVNGTPELNRVTFVPRAGYQGTLTLSYTGTDTGGRSYSGTIELTVTGSGASSGFRDMGNYPWAGASVDYLYQNGIVKGVSSTEFGPGQPITRGDFILMLCRAFDLNTGSTDNFTDVPGDSYYAWAVATAKGLGIAQGNGSGRFFPNGAVTRQDAMVFLQKTMRSAGWSIADGGFSWLSGYSDSGAVSGYAVGAMAAMVELGVLQGNGSGLLDPGGSLTRAEMAVILHRALTI